LAKDRIKFRVKEKLVEFYFDLQVGSNFKEMIIEIEKIELNKAGN